MKETQIFENEHIETLGAGIGVIVSNAHTFGTDALLLADFAAPKRNEIACDLGTGCGIIPFLWARDGLCEKICGVEIQNTGFKQLSRSVEMNSLDEKIVPINGDLKKYEDIPFCGKYGLVTMNPPYKAKNSGIKSRADSEKIARHETLCSFNDIAYSAARLLKFGGRFCVCIRPERLFEIMRIMSENALEPKKLRLVKSRAGERPWLCLVEARRGGKSGMTVEKDLIIYDGKDYSCEMLRILKPYREEKYGG